MKTLIGLILLVGGCDFSNEKKGDLKWIQRHEKMEQDKSRDPRQLDHEQEREEERREVKLEKKSANQKSERMAD